MTRLLSLLTVVLFMGVTGNAQAQREVPPPTHTPFDTQSSVGSPKAAPRPVQAVKAAEKAKTNAKPAPVQAATIPITAESKATASKKSPEKARKIAKPVTANGSKKSADTEKPKKSKSVRICKTPVRPDNHKLAQNKKASTKSAKKTEPKPVIRATTVPVE